MSRSRSRSDDRAAIPSVYQIGPGVATRERNEAASVALHEKQGTTVSELELVIAGGGLASARDRCLERRQGRSGRERERAGRLEPLAPAPHAILTG
jgi:hypothetical protein